MKYERSIDVGASAEATWRVVEDVASWPSWTPTFESVVPAGPLRVGTRVEVKQPGRPSVTYEIQALEPGRRFQWGSSGGGVEVWADHALEPTGTDTCRATLTFVMTGLVGSTVGTLWGRRIRQLVDTEAESLAKRLA